MGSEMDNHLVSSRLWFAPQRARSSTHTHTHTIAPPLTLQGAGIVWPTKIGKLELNLCQVLARQPFDQPRTGLQFGFVPPAW